MWTAVDTAEAAAAAIEALCASLEEEGSGGGSGQAPFRRWLCVHPWAISVRGTPPASQLPGAHTTRWLYAAPSAAPPVADGLAVRHLVAFPPSQRAAGEGRGPSAGRRRDRGAERSPPRWNRQRGGPSDGGGAAAAAAAAQSGYADDDLKAADDGEDYDPNDNVQDETELLAGWASNTDRAASPAVAATGTSPPVAVRQPRAKRALPVPAAPATATPRTVPASSGRPAWWLDGVRAASPTHGAGRRSPLHPSSREVKGASLVDDGGALRTAPTGIAGRVTSPSAALPGLAPWQTTDDGPGADIRSDADSTPPRRSGGAARFNRRSTATLVPLSPMQASSGRGGGGSGERSVRRLHGTGERRTGTSEEAEMVRRHLMQRGKAPRQSPPDGAGPRRQGPPRGMTVSLPALETTASLWRTGEGGAHRCQGGKVDGCSIDA